MRIASILVFDNIISGTTTTWYSGTQFQRTVGMASWCALQTYATGVGGTTPTLSVASETSTDSVTWIATGNTEINGQLISTAPSAAGQLLPGYGNNYLGLGAFVRFKIWLGAASGT